MSRHEVPEESSPPLSFVMSGYHAAAGAALANRGSFGLYWSLSAISSTYSRYLDFSSGSVSPQSSYNKAYGFSLRCVAKYSL